MTGDEVTSAQKERIAAAAYAGGNVHGIFEEDDEESLVCKVMLYLVK